MQRVLLGEFDSSDVCARAITALKAKGYSNLDAYMPYAAKNIEEALALPKSPLPKWVLLFGLVGAGVAYLILWWTQNVDFPLDVGGHPTNAIPAYVGITFETTVLFASGAAFFGMLHFCRLPRLWHPSFEVQGIERASVDRFFVVVEAASSPGDAGDIEAELARLGALRSVAFDLEGEAP